ncbi:MAG: hypothetical protein J6H21_04235 [Firmicutes bacterium]|nr:hypothetical protein [Bacillota bacterium]
MGLLSRILKEHGEYKAISIVGMAKNAGKTTALNFLIEEAYDEGIILGITSTGRDGETVDLVTETEKPKVYLYEDTVVSVPRQLFDLAEAGLEILSTTNYRTSLGELFLCKVKDSGYVQIAGPVASADTKKMYEEMLSLGVDLVLIDGAIDRKSVAAPESSDGVILSTGAVLSRDIKKVVRETSHVVELYSLPEVEDEKLKEIIREKLSEERILTIKEDMTYEVLDLKTGLGSGRKINEAISQEVKYVFLPGAFTGSIMGDIDPAKFKNVEFILKDPTRIFMDSILWMQMKKRGLKVKVLKNINVCAVTVNPFAPEGYSFDSEVLRDKMQEALPHIPVIDVRK